MPGHLLSLLFLFMFTAVSAQADHLQGTDGTTRRFLVWEDSSRAATASEALEAYHTGRFSPLDPPYLNPGFSTSIYWVALEMPPHQDELILVADNAHINHLEWYAVTDGRADSLAVTGDFHPFRQRPVVYNTFAFPLRPGVHLHLLKVDKAFESLQAPLKIVTRQELQNSRSDEALMNGILTGIILLIILFGIFLFLTTREPVYGWYALYVLNMLGWIWANKGLGFHFIWPDSSYFPSRSRLVFATANLIIGVQFLSAFIGLDKNSRIRKVLRVFQVIWGVILMLILWPMDYRVFGEYSMNLQSSIPVFTLVAVLFIAAALIQQIRKGNTPALIYLVATLVFLVFVVLESLYHLGSVKLPEFFAHFGIFTGVVLEMIIITFGLAARFNFYRKEKEAVLVQMHEQQKALTDTIITVEAEQRKALADKLHDEIGSMLSLTSLHLGAARNGGPANGEKLEQASGLLMTISQTIRNISHQLTPVAIEKYGLLHAIGDMVQVANSSGRIRIELVLIGFRNEQSYPSNYQHTLYRIIQELLQNTIKHADASNVLIQLVELEESCTIMVEDNGRGFDPAQAGPGLLRSVRAKVAYLQGRMDIDSQPQQGTMTNIEIPLPGKTLTEQH